MFDDFMFTVPQKIVFGQGVSQKVGEYVKKLGGQKVLCLYDAGVKAAGLVDPIISALRTDGIEVAVFDGVQSDPALEIVDACAAAAQENNVDVLIGIGGGSTIDTGKTARMLAINGGKAIDYTVAGGQKFAQEGLPYIVIPTTSGTGSEMTMASVLSDTKNGIKIPVYDLEKLHCTYALLDPELCVGMPPKITAATAIDALLHAAEAYTKPKMGSPFTDALNLYAFEQVYNNLPQVLANGKDVDARAQVQIGACMAGIGIALPGVHMGHGMAHAMGACWHMMHGIACAYTMPIMFEHIYDVVPDKVRRLAKIMNIAGADDRPIEEIRDIMVDRLWKLKTDCGIPTLRELGLSPEKDVETLMKQLAGEKRLLSQAGKPLPDDLLRKYCLEMFER